MSEEKTKPTETTAPETVNEAEQYKKDKNYIQGNRLYRAGLISLSVVLIILIAFRLLKISVVVGGLFINSLLYCFILLPMLLMIAGLFQTCKASKNANNYKLKSNRVQTVVILVLTLILAVLFVLNILYDNYRNATIDEVSVGNGESVTVVVSNTAANSISSMVQESNIHTIEVFKNYGIFKVPVVSATVSKDDFDYEVEKYSGDKKYIIKISEGTSGQMYPFDY